MRVVIATDALRPWQSPGLHAQNDNRACRGRCPRRPETKPALDAPVFILGRPEVAPYTSGNRELFPVFLSFLEILILVGVVSTILNLHKGDIQTHTQISISGIHIKGEGFQVRHLTYKGKIREDISANQSQVL